MDEILRSLVDRQAIDSETALQFGPSLQALSRAHTLRERVDALILLITSLHFEESRRAAESTSGDRAALQSFVALLESSPDVRELCVSTLEGIVRESDGTALFADAGIPEQRGFLAQLWDRLVRKVLPAPRDDRDLAHLIRSIYGSSEAVEIFLRTPPPLFDRMVRALTPGDRAAWDSFEASFADSLRIMAARIEALGFSPGMRARSKRGPVIESPFYLLTAATNSLIADWKENRDLSSSAAAWREVAASCGKAVNEIRHRLEMEGVNLSIVSGLEIIERSLTRMGYMVQIAELPPGEERSAAIHQLLRRVVHFTYSDRQVRHLLEWNLGLLNKKIVERAGKTGEHYIAATRKEYRHIWAAAAGGGLVTVFTAAIKLKVAGSGLPLFQEGFLVGLNYAISFLILQAFGFMLATKQPAMTAAALGAIIRDRKGQSRDDEIIDFFAHISSSQLAAAIANVAVVFIGAIGFEFLWRWITGGSYLAEPKAQHVFESLSPVNSGTVFYAAITGVILWLASLAGGWFSNFIAYNQIAEGIEDHHLGERFGREKMKRLADFVVRNGAGWGTNVSLGFMLGFTPVIGYFLGAPLDIRHVTLSSGMLALAAAALDKYSFGGGWFLLGVAGIATMFVLNLSVSFVLALWNAGKAYGFSGKDMRVLFQRFLERFARHPGMFFFPPPKEPVAPTSGTDQQAT